MSRMANAPDSKLEQRKGLGSSCEERGQAFSGSLLF